MGALILKVSAFIVFAEVITQVANRYFGFGLDSTTYIAITALVAAWGRDA